MSKALELKAKLERAMAEGNDPEIRGLSGITSSKKISSDNTYSDTNGTISENSMNQNHTNFAPLNVDEQIYSSKAEFRRRDIEGCDLHQIKHVEQGESFGRRSSGCNLGISQNLSFKEASANFVTEFSQLDQSVGNEDETHLKAAKLAPGFLRSCLKGQSIGTEIYNRSSAPAEHRTGIVVESASRGDYDGFFNDMPEKNNNRIHCSDVAGLHAELTQPDHQHRNHYHQTSHAERKVKDAESLRVKRGITGSLDCFMYSGEACSSEIATSHSKPISNMASSRRDDAATAAFIPQRPRTNLLIEDEEDDGLLIFEQLGAENASFINNPSFQQDDEFQAQIASVARLGPAAVRERARKELGHPVADHVMGPALRAQGMVQRFKIGSVAKGQKNEGISLTNSHSHEISNRSNLLDSGFPMHVHLAKTERAMQTRALSTSAVERSGFQMSPKDSMGRTKTSPAMKLPMLR